MHAAATILATNAVATEDSVSGDSPLLGSDASKTSVDMSNSGASEVFRSSATIDAILTVDANAAHEAIGTIAIIWTVNIITSNSAVSTMDANAAMDAIRAGSTSGTNDASAARPPSKPW